MAKFIKFILVACLLKAVFANLPLHLADQRLLLSLDTKDTLLEETKSGRLPTNIIPINYKLDIIPILNDAELEENKFTAPGTVEILVFAQTKSNYITLHKNGIEIKNIQVVDENGKTLDLDRFEENSTNETFVIYMQEYLFPNLHYRIQINFISQVNSGMDGLYHSSYINKNGKKRYLAATQFEKTGARKAFPCLDEPKLRSTFDIKIGRNASRGYHSLSNMNIVNTFDITGMPGYVFDEYEQTPSMSTYLIAIIVSDFIYTESNADKTVKIWGPPNQMSNNAANFSSNIAKKLRDFFGEYFNISYHLNKLDSVAVPDFASGAMENWGLNTYRVPTLLFVEGDMTQFELWRQAAVISHEIAHSWFGNSVTINWWNDLWIKEGFARYLQFIGVAAAESSMEAIDRYVLDTIQIAMDNDIGEKTHEVRGSWETEIRFQNSRIIYEKGASLIRMMQAFLTEEVLLTGLRKYIRKFANGATVQDDLFEVLNEEATIANKLPVGTSVKSIMDSWTLQSGYPILNVTRIQEGNVVASVRSFDKQNRLTPNSTSKWTIPITFTTLSNPVLTSYEPKVWIMTDHNEITLPINITNQEWILLNPDARSYYRVIYEDSILKRIKEQLSENNTVFTAASRSQLIDDYFAASFHGYESISNALDLTLYLHNEQSLSPWITSLTHLRKIYNYLSSSDDLDKFRKYVASKIKPQLQRLLDFDVYPNSDTPRAILRAQLYDWGCSLELEICIKSSLDLMKQWQYNPSHNPIVADLQPASYCTAYAFGDEETKEFIKTQSINIALSNKQRELLYTSQSCEQNYTKLFKSLEDTLDSNTVIPLKDRKALVKKIGTTTFGQRLILKFLRKNIQKVITVLEEDTISEVISTISPYITSSLEVQRFLDEYENILSDAVINSIKNSIQIIAKNKEWVIKFGNETITWFKANNILIS